MIILSGKLSETFKLFCWRVFIVMQISLVSLVLMPIILLSCEKKSTPSATPQITEPSSLFTITPNEENILIPSECEG
jgi:hypothetical protein